MAKKKKSVVQPDPVVVINDTYNVKLATNCMILQKKVSQENDEELSKEEKKEGYKTLGYFSTWDYLGTILSRDMQRDKALKAEKITVEEFLKNLKEVSSEIRKIFKSIEEKTENKK